MALELRQQLKLTQQLVMTPQLQQAIKLLQLSRTELIETIQQELLENPFLEETEPEPCLEPKQNEDYEQQDKKSDSSDFNDKDYNLNTDYFNDNNFTQKEHEQERADRIYDDDIRRNADWEDYLGDFASTSKHALGRDYENFEDINTLETQFATKPSLESHLFWQLRLSKLSEKEKEIGEAILGNLSSTGYFQATLEEIAEFTSSKISQVEKVLIAIQHFDPVGVAARSAKECLLTQLQVLGYDRDPVLVEIIKDHIEDLEQKRYKPLLKKFKLSLDDLQEYINIIAGCLDPFPGAAYGNDEPFFICPDVFAYKHEKDFIIVLNDEDMPHIQMTDFRPEQLPRVKASDKEYFQEKIRAASWLIKSLHQRQRTLYKVAESIVEYQRGFFEHGVSHLKPLILKDIADDINMHESTVSRITTNKYIATPHGTFELKFFFSSALGLDDGSLVGSESVKATIKKFINEENPKEPLSDEKIGEMLKEQLKVNIARRTVAKYRTALQIESSSKRKKIF